MEQNQDLVTILQASQLIGERYDTTAISWKKRGWMNVSNYPNSPMFMRPQIQQWRLSIPKRRNDLPLRTRWLPWGFGKCAEFLDIPRLKLEDHYMVLEIPYYRGPPIRTRSKHQNSWEVLFNPTEVEEWLYDNKEKIDVLLSPKRDDGTA